MYVVGVHSRLYSASVMFQQPSKLVCPELLTAGLILPELEKLSALEGLDFSDNQLSGETSVQKVFHLTERCQLLGMAPVQNIQQRGKVHPFFFFFPLFLHRSSI